jgi:hypothetical protein
MIPSESAELVFPIEGLDLPAAAASLRAQLVEYPQRAER